MAVFFCHSARILVGGIFFYSCLHIHNDQSRLHVSVCMRVSVVYVLREGIILMMIMEKKKKKKIYMAK